MTLSTVCTSALTPDVLVEKCPRLCTGKVLIIGDTMLDEYLTGQAERISPEAPVPVVRVQEQLFVLGGAGNVAKNICALQAQPVIVSARGSDTSGEVMAAMMEKDGITASFLDIPERPTTIKTRVLAAGQQMLRIDKESNLPLPVQASQRLLQQVEEHLTDIRAIVVSDYGKGVITQEVMAGLLACAAKKNIPVLVDPKPCNKHLYRHVTLLTPNTKEAGELANMPVKTPAEIVQAGRFLMETLQCPNLIITMGPQGMAVFETANTIWHIPTVAQHVFDVTGAGDTVIATLSLGLGAGLSLVESAVLANYAAGIVVGQVGAATASIQEVQNAIKTLPFSPPQQWQ